MVSLLVSSLKVKENELVRRNFYGAECFGLRNIYLFLCHRDMVIFFYQIVSIYLLIYGGIESLSKGRNKVDEKWMDSEPLLLEKVSLMVPVVFVKTNLILSFLQILAQGFQGGQSIYQFTVLALFNFVDKQLLKLNNSDAIIEAFIAYPILLGLFAPLVLSWHLCVSGIGVDSNNKACFHVEIFGEDSFLARRGTIMDRSEVETNENFTPLPSTSSVVAAAVDGKRKSKHIVQWSLEKFVPEENVIFKLIHVHVGISSVPTPMVNSIPISQVSEEVATAYIKDIEWQTSELNPHVHQLLGLHPYLNNVIIPVSSTLVGTILAWGLMPRLLRRFHKYTMQGYYALPIGSPADLYVDFTNYFNIAVCCTDRLASIGLFAIDLRALAEACGVAVQFILTVGGIGVDTAIGLTTTSLLNAEKFLVIVSNSHHFIHCS